MFNIRPQYDGDDLPLPTINWAQNAGGQKPQRQQKQYEQPCFNCDEDDDDGLPIPTINWNRR